MNRFQIQQHGMDFYVLDLNDSNPLWGKCATLEQAQKLLEGVMRIKGISEQLTA